MMTTAAPSETFWTALGSVAAALGVLATLYVGWLAWRTAVPRRKVRWEAEVKPLLHGVGHGALTVSHSGATLSRPHVLELKLTNAGNRDLEASHFGGQPIDFTSSAVFIDVLAQSSSPSSQRVIPVTFSGTKLILTPGTLHRRQTVTYTALVDGADPTIDAVASLSNGDFQRRRAASADQSERRLQVTVAIMGLLTSVVAVVVQALTDR
ncbi:hypothetical protein ACFOZ0_06505 [Streptomyces yaanensis]|uniref:Uncharacterized protein n=1 Tax=Streptomyces yaanensis TaxID=1142239 RepID=A0ABV7S8T8_9ACTN|nr:hypothetical protein [Streptomyces sp. CGMCC 4.7035]WNC02451.1 hypothetical protein Q2K21_32765 [Streptomyces sp. CGMCC 4.7035]